MQNHFLTHEEYERFWFRFEGIRGKIARALRPHGLQNAKWVLDAPAGHGLFAYEIALQAPRSHVLGLGLWNDVRDFKATRALETYAEVLRTVTYVECDATNLPFANDNLDFAVNFLGLEDLQMTLGHPGVAQAFAEFARTLRPGGILQIAVNIEGAELDEMLNKEVTEFIGHNATFKEKDYYLNQLENTGIELLEERWEYSQKKLTAQ
ncbi:MAG: class I SAM-dependent methyltransferase, partial [Candidatus Hodarchaeales archaeon]